MLLCLNKKFNSLPQEMCQRRPSLLIPEATKPHWESLRAYLRYVRLQALKAPDPQFFNLNMGRIFHYGLSIRFPKANSPSPEQ